MKAPLAIVLLCLLTTVSFAEETLDIVTTYKGEASQKRTLRGNAQIRKVITGFVRGDRDGRMEMTSLELKPGKHLIVVKRGNQVTCPGMLPTHTGEMFLKNFFRARAQGQQTACSANLKNIATALEMWRSDNGGDLPKNLNLLAPNYLRTIPTCPSGETARFYLSSYKIDNGEYSVRCRSDHSKAGCRAGYPLYTSQRGLIKKR